MSSNRDDVACSILIHASACEEVFIASCLNYIGKVVRWICTLLHTGLRGHRLFVHFVQTVAFQQPRDTLLFSWRHYRGA